MALAGEAFVIMWHDISEEGDADYNQWHTRQHMPERIDLPGFLRSRRGVNRSLDRQRYFTLYEGDSLETFLSPEYARSLNFPTEWTRRVAPSFRNFLRTACSVTNTGGQGIGGGIATLRASLPDGATEAETLKSLEPIVDEIAALPSVTAVHVGCDRTAFAGGATKETELRPAMSEPRFDLVVVVEGIGLAELSADEPVMMAAMARSRCRDVTAQSYDVAYILARPGL
jgi:hypothetical protein